MSKIYLNDYGLRITFQFDDDISTFQSGLIKYRKPDETEGEWTAVKGTGNTIYYVIQEDDLDVVGTWILQPYLVLSDWTGHGTPGRLIVYEQFT